MIHYSFIGYIIASAIILLLCVVAYRILLENRVVPTINRKILLAIYGFMIFVPLIVAIIPEPSGNISLEIGELKTESIIENNNEIEAVNSSFQISRIFPWILNLYYAGVFIMFGFSVCVFSRLIFLIKKSQKLEFNGTEVYIHNVKKLSSFSWFNRIFLYSDSIKSSSKDMDILLGHELAHLKKNHWIDLAIAQIVIIFQWFNPAAWFMRNELQRIHEYEADEAVLESGVNESEYQMFLINNISRNRFSGLTDGLNNCSLKKRIIMMKKKSFKSNWVTRGLALAAVAVAGGAVIHIPVVASSLSLPEKTDSAIIPTSDSPLLNNANKDSEIKISSKTDSEVSDTQKQIKITAKSDSEIKDTQKQIKITTKSDSEIKDSQEGTMPVVKKDENEPYFATEKVAEYEGGQTQLMNDLANTVRYPEEAYNANIQGRVVVRFQINRDGSISNCEVVRGVDPSLDAEAIRAVENLPHKWIPGEIKGQPVASIFNLPVTFKLKDSEEKSK